MMPIIDYSLELDIWNSVQWYKYCI